MSGPSQDGLAEFLYGSVIHLLRVLSCDKLNPSMIQKLFTNTLKSVEKLPYFEELWKYIPNNLGNEAAYKIYDFNEKLSCTEEKLNIPTDLNKIIIGLASCCTEQLGKNKEVDENDIDLLSRIFMVHIKYYADDKREPITDHLDNSFFTRSLNIFRNAQISEPYTAILYTQEEARILSMKNKEKFSPNISPIKKLEEKKYDELPTQKIADFKSQKSKPLPEIYRTMSQMFYVLNDTLEQLNEFSKNTNLEKINEIVKEIQQRKVIIDQVMQETKQYDGSEKFVDDMKESAMKNILDTSLPGLIKENLAKISEQLNKPAIVKEVTKEIKPQEHACDLTPYCKIAKKFVSKLPCSHYGCAPCFAEYFFMSSYYFVAML